MGTKALSAAKSWWVYVIETEKGMLYTGITTDVERRYRQHAGELTGGAKFFRSQAPKRLRFKKRFPDRAAASRFEAQVKALPREEKLLLLKG